MSKVRVMGLLEKEHTLQCSVWTGVGLSHKSICQIRTEYSYSTVVDGLKGLRLGGYI